MYPDLYEASVVELQAGLDACHFSSVDLVKVIFALRRYWLIGRTHDLLARIRRHILRVLTKLISRALGCGRCSR